eukprot:m.167184 g.167184  ORF g.167184 m.167184 type:complete len:413 (+) comp17765_c0_seq4:315-1553(+)
MVPWAQVLAYLWILVMVSVLCGLLPWGLYEMYHHHYETHVKAWFAAGVFVCLAVPISVWQIAQHFAHWNRPRLQRHVVRILWMVPIYAINSWLALRFDGAAIYLDTVRECYEAYVIYNFFAFLMEFLHQRPGFEQQLAQRPKKPHMFPLCCVTPWTMGRPFLRKCRHGVVSYVIVRPLCTAIALISELLDGYGEGEIDFSKTWIYTVIITNFSQAWAMYCLILLYVALKPDLKPIKPLPKFMTIKAVVFFSFWQSVLIAVLVHTGAIKNKETWTHYTQQSVAAGLQDFLVCVEMFIAAVGHHYIFSYKEYLPQGDPEATRSLSFRESLRHMFDVSDVHSDMMNHLQAVSTLSAEAGAKLNPLSSTAHLSDKTPLLSGSDLPLGMQVDSDSDTDEAVQPTPMPKQGYGTASNV